MTYEQADTLIRLVLWVGVMVVVYGFGTVCLLGIISKKLGKRD